MWDRNLIEAEVLLESKLSQVTKYEESFGIELKTLEDALKKFKTNLRELEIDEFIEKSPADDTQDPAASANTLSKCQVKNQDK